MGILTKFFGSSSPFDQLHEHTKKVHECVKLLLPITEALLAEDYEKVEELHNEVSRIEHEADIFKTALRDELDGLYFLSIGKNELNKFLTYQDNVADAAEDYAVVVNLRKTKIPEELKTEFKDYVTKVVNISDNLLSIAKRLSNLAESAFTGEEANEVTKAIEAIGQAEWEADKFGMRFSKHFYSMEDKIDPVTIFFLDKLCNRLGAVANNAEKTAKYLHLIIRNK